MANPLLTESTFDLYDYGSGDNPVPNPMTVRGAATKGMACSLIVLVSSIAVSRLTFINLSLFWPLLISALVFCGIIHFLPKTACILAPVFSLVQGSILGIIANFVISFQLPIPALFFLLCGINLTELEFEICGNSEALFSTICASAAMSFACGIGLFKAKQTESFILFGCIIGTLLCFGILLLSNQMGFTIVPIHSSLFFIGICFLFSAFLCWPVTFCLSRDFDNIWIGTQSNVPKYMEWYCAFALMLTLTWCYIEIIKWFIMGLISSAVNPRSS